MSIEERSKVKTTCLRLSASLELISRYADLLEQVGGDDPPAISMHDTTDPTIWTLNAYYQSSPKLAEIKKQLAEVYSPLPDIEFETLEDKDWVAIVQRGLCPVKAGRFFIHGSHDRALAGERAGDIEIDAGQAFGTAHHGTTKGCLLALDHLFKCKQGRQMKNVLDLGTGSGLLAIAVARSLRQKVLASDIDPISVETAMQNATLNHVGPFVCTLEASGLNHPALRSKAPYDMIIANILAAPLHGLAPDIAKSMRTGGQLILSGLLRTQSRSIEARYRGHGFILVKRLPLDEWMTLILSSRQ